MINTLSNIDNVIEDYTSKFISFSKQSIDEILINKENILIEAEKLINECFSYINNIKNESSNNNLIERLNQIYSLYRNAILLPCVNEINLITSTSKPSKYINIINFNCYLVMLEKGFNNLEIFDVSQKEKFLLSIEIIKKNILRLRNLKNSRIQNNFESFFSKLFGNDTLKNQIQLEELNFDGFHSSKDSKILFNDNDDYETFIEKAILYMLN